MGLQCYFPGIAIHIDTYLGGGGYDLIKEGPEELSVSISYAYFKATFSYATLAIARSNHFLQDKN